MTGGAASGPRDWVAELMVTFTIFPNTNATKKRELTLSLPKLAELIRSTSATRKDKLPWLKLASFGEYKSLKGSLRHDGNVVMIYGLEADYDGEKISFDQAHEILLKAGVLSILYTSPSHTEDSPRWRVLAFFSVPHDPDKRAKLFGRLNGLFDAEFSAESWTLSQSYYFGPVNRNPSHRVEIIEGEPIDLLYDLDINWMGKPGVKPAVIVRNSNGARQRYDRLDEEQMLRDVMSGASFHGALVRLVGKWARERRPMMWARDQLFAAFDAVPEEVKATPRWQSRREDIDRCVEDIYIKEADKRDEADAAREARGERRAQGKPAEPDADKGTAAEYQALRENLAQGEGGNVYPTHANLLMILVGDPLLSGLVQRDEFANRVEITRPPPVPVRGQMRAAGPYPRQLDDDDRTNILAYLHQAWARGFRRGALIECLAAQASASRYHPVRDWLRSLKWDGKPRLDSWLTMTFGCPLDEYHTSVAAKVPIAAVRRVMQPGCKFDYLMVIEGNQGILKSTAIATLFGAKWYTDDMPRDIGTRDAAMSLSGGRWCVELAEIEQLLRATPETLKAFLSRQVDRYRPPYGIDVIEYPRQCVMIGTTNGDSYLRDATGNRRIWPIKALTIDGADIDWLASNREQIWAEAAAREAKGEAIWMDTAPARDRAEVEQSARMVSDPWEDRVHQHIAGLATVNVSDVLKDVLFVDLPHQDKKTEMRVAEILRAAGWGRVVRWDGDRKKAVKLWVRNEPAESP